MGAENTPDSAQAHQDFWRSSRVVGWLYQSQHSVLPQALSLIKRLNRGAAGAFTAGIAPVTIPTQKGVETFSVDEHPRPEPTLETLAKLPPVFKKGGTVTAGIASGMGDGAAANVVMSEEALRRWGISAVDPTIMGIGPVEAVRQALKRASMTLDEIDIIELNETSVLASTWLGGAIALAHPLGASGARIVANLTHNLHRLDLKYALGTACIGGGQGIAVILEKV
ncbi:hypothetical protein FRC01_014210 [Tulasnella sp. 417]|nr:hypothetical protein FRC01_014210 [Tulasnella sp. 417]